MTTEEREKYAAELEEISERLDAIKRHLEAAHETRADPLDGSLMGAASATEEAAQLASMAGDTLAGRPR